MKRYVKNVLDKLGHTKTRIEHAPHEWNVPIYRKNRQFATEDDSAPVLGQAQIKYTQRVDGSSIIK